MAAETCLQWITNEQNVLETADYGRNQRAIDEAIAVQRTKNNVVNDYRSEIDRAHISEEKQRQVVDRAYNNLHVIADKRLGCLEAMSDVTKLEDLFAKISSDFSDKATQLTVDQSSRKVPTTGLYDGCIANSSQGCILAMRDAWSWIGKLLKCSEIHLQNAAEYQQFFGDVKEYEQWMPVELTRAEELLNSRSLKRNSQGEDAARLLLEMKTALTMFLHWRGKVITMFERSRKVVPVQLRNRKVDYNRPVIALASYKTSQINIKEGEEVTLLDNAQSQIWQVRNLRAQEAEVPSTILVIPGPDSAAIETALRLCLQYLATWTNMVKRIGSTIILFLLQVIREWTAEEEQMLRALSAMDKQEVLHLFKSIEETFSPYWDEFPPYKLLQKRMDKTKQILSQTPDADSKGQNGQLLVIQTAILEELLARFRDFWTYWEKYKVLMETSRHPEYLLVAKNWEDYKFINTTEWIKKYGTMMDGLDDIDWAEFGSLAETEPAVDPDEIYTMERAKETAETSQISQSEQEEKQTFVITAVVDPRTGEEISLDQAIALKVINQSEGKYVNPATGETMPIPMAMNAGKIKVELMTVKKSEEKKRDIGLVTIKTYKESRPYTIKEVIDAVTDKHLSVDEAVKAGILDQKKGIYRNKNTKEELTMADALDSGLLVVEFENDPDMKGNEPEVQTKTYAVHGVVDMQQKKRLTYQEAVRVGIINQDTGEYYNNATGEHVYVGDAIKKGHIKATVVRDPKQLDIAPGNRVTLADSAMTNLREKLIQSSTIGALRRAAGGSSAGANGTVTNGK